MKQKIVLFIFVSSIVVMPVANANWYQDIINAIIAQGTISNGFLANIDAQQEDIVDSQHNVEKVVRTVNRDLTGNYGWGAYQSHDYQSYGAGARDWQSVIKMAQSGQGNGDLGSVIGDIANQFPADRGSYNRGISSGDAQKYYALKSETVLATRAASQLDYNKIQDQITYQQMLQQQIEKTSDTKAAIDLLNRIQVEGNLINLEILRQTALSNQQQSVTEQANINSALSNAKFLTK